MSSCCRAEPCEELFGPRTAAWDLENYRWKGLPLLERRMLAALPTPLTGETRVLEIGGGIGALQAELLQRGAGTGEVVELVGAYAPYARELARELHLEGRTEFRVVDLLDETDAVPPADVVILNRVVCCSADGLELTTAAAALTRGALLLSFPRHIALLHWAARAQHALFRLFGRRYRFYVRPAAAIIAAAERAGLVLTAHDRSGFWEYVALRRP